MGEKINISTVEKLLIVGAIFFREGCPNCGCRQGPWRCLKSPWCCQSRSNAAISLAFPLAGRYRRPGPSGVCRCASSVRNWRSSESEILHIARPLRRFPVGDFGVGLLVGGVRGLVAAVDAAAFHGRSPGRKNCLLPTFYARFRKIPSGPCS